MCIYYESILYTPYYIYMYTEDMPRVWPMLTASIDFNDKSIVYVLYIYIICSLKLLWFYYHYIIH